LRGEEGMLRSFAIASIISFYPFWRRVRGSYE